MSFALIRGALVAALQAAAGLVAVEDEMPDSLVPPALCVRWNGSNPGSQSGLVQHAFIIEIWPSTDLTSEPHYETRDQLAQLAIGVVASLMLDGAAVAAWSASADEQRELGQQRYRIATLTVLVTEPMLCST